MELAGYGYTDRCIGREHARLGLKPADHKEECRARIVRNMTADDNFREYRSRKTELLKQHTLKQELVNEILYQSQQARRSDSRSESKIKHLRLQLVAESNEDRSKRQKVSHPADLEQEGLVMESERDRLQRYSDCYFLMQLK